MQRKERTQSRARKIGTARAQERERERESAKALVRLSTDVLEKTIAGASIRLSLRATNHLQA